MPTGETIRKINVGGTEHDVVGSADAQWGSIQGSIASQTDLMGALNKKQPKTLSVPIEMLSGTKLTVESALQGLNEGKQDELTFDDTPTVGSNNPVKSGGIYPKIVHEIVRTGVTVSANGQVRIPASGTDSRISTASNCVVKPICNFKSNGTPYKWKALNVNDGYATITMAEAISNVAIGVEVINY